MVKSQRAARIPGCRKAGAKVLLSSPPILEPSFLAPQLEYRNCLVLSLEPRKREVSHKRNGNSILRLGGGGEGERERVRRPIYNGGRFPIVGVSNSPVHLTIPPDSHAIPERRRRRRDRGRRRSVPPLCLTTERNRENAAVTLSRSDTANSPLDPCRSINLSPCPGQSEK